MGLKFQLLHLHTETVITNLLHTVVPKRAHYYFFDLIKQCKEEVRFCTHPENKRTHVLPTFFGPVFVHTEKNFETYYHFFTTLLKLEPKLAEICAAGADGEEALIKAIRTAFSEDLILLRCFIHMKDSLRHKLTEMLMPEKYREEILKDILECSKEMFTPKGYLMPVTLKILIEGLAISRISGIT